MAWFNAMRFRNDFFYFIVKIIILELWHIETAFIIHYHLSSKIFTFKYNWLCQSFTLLNSKKKLRFVFNFCSICILSVQSEYTIIDFSFSKTHIKRVHNMKKFHVYCVNDIRCSNINCCPLFYLCLLLKVFFNSSHIILITIFNRVHYCL